MKRLLVTGASGYLGRALAAAAGPAGWETYGTYFSHPTPPANGQAFALDLRQPAEVQRLFDQLQPQAVIHTACSNRDVTNLDSIEPAARSLAQACRDHGARLVHVSTDLVFDGEHPPYADSSLPNPILPYGHSKAAAEAAIGDIYPAAAIGRPSLIWALDPLDRQTAWLVDGARLGTKVTLFTDEVRCPVHLPDLVSALLELAQRPDIGGPINLGGAQPLNRWEFGLRLLEALDLPRGPNVVPSTVAESGLIRARDLSLRCDRAAHSLAARLRGVDEVLSSAPERSRRPRYCEG
ncbi:MAG: sugar nucleotide-binding protein [Anaerolineales bacterium]